MDSEQQQPAPGLYVPPQYVADPTGAILQPAGQPQAHAAATPAAPVYAQAPQAAYAAPAYASAQQGQEIKAYVALPIAVPAGRGQWRDPFCCCGFDILLACCFPAYRFGLTLERAGFMPCVAAGVIYGIFWCGAIIAVSLSFHIYQPSFLMSALVFVFWFIVSYIGFAARMHIKHKFDIPINPISDLCVHTCCPAISLVQEGRQVDRSVGLTVC